MTTEKDRILLAEAMGICPTFIIKRTVSSNYNVITKSGCENCDGGIHKDFHPFTDANDDYAVLEWMRETFKPEQMRAACDVLLAIWEKRWDDSPIDAELPYSWFRETGDNARAALAVIKEQT